MKLNPLWLVLLAISSLLSACGDDDRLSEPSAEHGSGSGKGGSGSEIVVSGKGGSDAGEGTVVSGKGGSDAGGTGALHDVPCVDQQYSQLQLFDVPAAAVAMDESSEDGVFTTFIDTRGGAVTGTSVTESYVYGRFSESGFEKVDLGDGDAFQSADWDIGLRRYILRLNSGVSGPSTVTGARTVPNTTFGSLTSVPTDVSFRTEAYYTESCEFVSDSSGNGGPGTAIASWWSYRGCVAMTHNVYVIKLANERHVKFEVLSYYAPEDQQICDETGSVPITSTGSPSAGNMRVRWAFID